MQKNKIFINFHWLHKKVEDLNWINRYSKIFIDAPLCVHTQDENLKGKTAELLDFTVAAVLYFS
jgi:hypothetical protein